MCFGNTLREKTTCSHCLGKQVPTGVFLLPSGPKATVAPALQQGGGRDLFVLEEG